MFSRFVEMGARVYSIAGLVTALVMLDKCQTAPCEEDGCEVGGGAGQAGDGGAEVGGGGSGGAAGSGQGGAGATGGSEMGGAPDGGGGQAGAGGCAPLFACGPKDCGLVDDGCGALLDCDATGAEPTTCASQVAGQDQEGPMTCSTTTHLCECPAEGNSPAALALCEGPSAEPPVNDYCAQGGGCTTAFCGIPPVPKVPPECIFSGQNLDGAPVWCCVTPQ